MAIGLDPVTVQWAIEVRRRQRVSDRYLGDIHRLQCEQRLRESDKEPGRWGWPAIERRATMVATEYESGVRLPVIRLGWRSILCSSSSYSYLDATVTSAGLPTLDYCRYSSYDWKFGGKAGRPSKLDKGSRTIFPCFLLQKWLQQEKWRKNIGAQLVGLQFGQVYYSWK